MQPCPPQGQWGGGHTHTTDCTFPPRIHTPRFSPTISTFYGDLSQVLARTHAPPKLSLPCIGCPSAGGLQPHLPPLPHAGSRGPAHNTEPDCLLIVLGEVIGKTGREKRWDEPMLRRERERQKQAKGKIMGEVPKTKEPMLQLASPHSLSLSSIFPTSASH